MPFIRRFRARRPVYRRRRAVGARRLPLYAPVSKLRATRVSTPTFSETYRLGTVVSNPATGNTSGVWKASLLGIPQIANYTNLYNQYCIKRVTLTIMPAYTMYDSENLATTSAAIITVPRLVYAVQDSAQQPTPTGENDVLADNAHKIRMMNRPVKISFRPVAELGASASTGGFVSESKRMRWISTANPEVLHAGVAYSFTQAIQNTVQNDPIATVYVKVTFSLRDPK